MKVDLVDHMGSDLTVVNAARVSFDKESELKPDGDIKDSDWRLIHYLAAHNHWTPFGHCTATFRIKAPLFVARQLGKHQVGLVWNEVSRRYVDSEPEFYVPGSWRSRAPNVKQGSGDASVILWSMWDFDTGEEDIATHHSDSLRLYQHLLAQGVCPEQARMVLPQSMYTEWYWTGSLAAFARVCKLRLDPHTQKETQEIAKMISDHMADLFPVSWKALLE